MNGEVEFVDVVTWAVSKATDEQLAALHTLSVSLSKRRADAKNGTTVGVPPPKTQEDLPTRVMDVLRAGERRTSSVLAMTLGYPIKQVSSTLATLCKQGKLKRTTTRSGPGGAYTYWRGK